jgi:primase-polymerase (primpol)-like protein
MNSGGTSGRNPHTMWSARTGITTSGTFDDPVRCYLCGEVDGIGYVLTAEDKLVGIDLDHCRKADGVENSLKVFLVVHVTYSHGNKKFHERKMK